MIEIWEVMGQGRYLRKLDKSREYPNEYLCLFLLSSVFLCRLVFMCSVCDCIYVYEHMCMCICRCVSRWYVREYMSVHLYTHSTCTFLSLTANFIDCSIFSLPYFFTSSQYWCFNKVFCSLPLSSKFLKGHLFQSIF